jgi:flagellin
MTRINTNVTSLISTRILNANQDALNTSLERLSTGLRINSGSDDPSGLIASETLRGQTSALESAISNGERASNVIATAEGALNEVSSLLTEMQSLVSSAASTTGMTDEEVEAQQLELDSILDTIDRISSSTEFGGTKLLDGSLDYTVSGSMSAFDDYTIKSATLVGGDAKSVTVQIYDSAELAKTGTASGATKAVTLKITGVDGTKTYSFASGAANSAIVNAVKADSSLTGVSSYLSGNYVKFTSTEYGEDAFVKVEAVSGTYGGTGTDKGEDVKARVNGQDAVCNGLNVSLNTSSLSVEMDLNSKATGSKTFNITDGGANFSLAADVTSGLASIGIESVTADNLGNLDGKLSTLATGQDNSLSSDNLDTAQGIIEDAITQVASLRARLGAFESVTIDSTVNSMEVALENTTAAESAIRDADFATETSNMTTQQILVSAATTVLKQANSAPQTALSLLS